MVPRRPLVESRVGVGVGFCFGTLRDAHCTLSTAGRPPARAGLAQITGNTKHFTAVVAKPDPAGSFGFALGTLANGTHIVHHVMLPDTVLEVDDELDMINNEIAAKLSHDEVILFLSKSSALSLSLTRINEHYVDVVLEKKDGSFGVSLGSQVGPLLGNFDIVSGV